ncbi:jg22364 [Pararge aegeria aegeria]|uniref:Jg22364 protein n=1 Tax=Pararge aegeria aegeria TaxID=348720 RepID=A0A8S4S6C5_9NEOP|nr:jg22364 [Pararge aegeria aegeria]
MKENIVRKPAWLRVIHNVLKGVWSPPIRTGPAWWTTALTPSHCGRRPVPSSVPAMGCDDDDDNDGDDITITSLLNSILYYPTYLQRVCRGPPNSFLLPPTDTGQFQPN